MTIHHMDRTYHDNIQDYLVHRAHSVRVDANLNLLNLAVYSENFYVEFLNELLDLRLENANASKRNKPGIDLIDWKNRVAAQVSVTCAPQTIREKIRNSIQKFDKPEGDWQFYFVPITDKAPDLQKDFELPDGLKFKKDRDVLDITRIMELVDSKVSAKKRVLSALVDRYSKDETDYLELRMRLDDLLLLTWKAHRSYKLMQTDEIDQRLFPNVQNAAQFEALGKRTGEEAESPVWSIIRKSWNEAINHSVMIQGGGGIGKTVTLFSLTNMDRVTIPAPAVYIPMFELVNQEGKVINLTDYFQSADAFPSLTAKQRESLSALAARQWNQSPSLLVLLDGFNEVPGKQRWNVLQMLRTWHGKNQGAQIIAVSRPMDNLSLETAFGKETISVTLSELTKERVTAYLSSPQGEGVRIPEPNAPIWETIVYPLFLNLYIKADRLRDQHAWKDYPLDIREVVSPGSIIWNYLQRELLRQDDESWILRCALACEYFAPILAHHMLESYDYTISQRDALLVIQKAVAALDLERMPLHISELISWWEMQELSLEPPTFLKELDWLDIVLRECGLLVPYQEGKKKTGRKQETRYEFLHQCFRDCLAGIHLLNEAETVEQDNLPEIWEQFQNSLAIDYAAELINPSVLDQLWDANRKATQFDRINNSKNHVATFNLLELYKRNNDLQKELNFSGMDLRGRSLTRYLGRDGISLPLFRSRAMSHMTAFDRSTFETDGHKGTIYSIVAMPDGRIASGSNDGTIKIWNYSTGQCLQTLKGDNCSVNCLAIVGEKFIISGSSDHTIRCWDSMTGQCLQILKGHKDTITHLKTLSNGLVVSVGSRSEIGGDISQKDYAPRIWNPVTGKCLHTLIGHRTPVTCINTVQEKWIVSGSWDGKVFVWDASSGKCIQKIDAHKGSIQCIESLPDNQIITAGADAILRVWDVASGQCLQTLEGHEKWVTCLAILPDGGVVSGSIDSTIRVWNVDTGSCRQILRGHNGPIMCVSTDQDGRIISGSHDMTIRVWDAESREPLQTLRGHTSMITCICVLPSGFIVSGALDSDCSLRLWDISTGNCLQVMQGTHNIIYNVVVTSCGLIASGSRRDDSLRVWDVSTRRCIRTLDGHQGGITCVAKSASSAIVSGSYDNSLRVWNIRLGQCLHILRGHDDVVTCVCTLPGEIIVSGSRDNCLRVWNAGTGECLNILRGHTAAVLCVVAHSNNIIISSSADNTLRIWNTQTGECLKTLSDHTGGILCLAVLPDGKVIGGSIDTNLYLWDIPSGKCISAFAGQWTAPYTLGVLSDRSIISIESNGIGRWDLDSGKYTRYKTHKCRIVSYDILHDGNLICGTTDNSLVVLEPNSGDFIDELDATEVPVAMMDFSDAQLSKDLAHLLWINGAIVTNNQTNSSAGTVKTNANVDIR